MTNTAYSITSSNHFHKSSLSINHCHATTLNSIKSLQCCLLLFFYPIHSGPMISKNMSLFFNTLLKKPSEWIKHIPTSNISLKLFDLE